MVHLEDSSRFEAFCAQLAREGIRFYVSEERPGWVFAADEVAHAIILEQLSLFKNPSAFDNLRPGFLTPSLLRSPVTTIMVVAMIIGAPLTSGFESFEFGEVFVQMIFAGEEGSPFDSGESWRLFTPVLLHFGLEHLAFNLIGVYIVAVRLEPAIGSFTFLALCVAAAAVGNVTQFIFGNALFYGGMSGVVLALVGFGLIWRALWPARDIGLPSGIYVVCVLVTVVGFTGILDGLTGGSALANWVHLGGLLTGLGMGLLVTPVYKYFSLPA